MTKNDSVLF